MGKRTFETVLAGVLLGLAVVAMCHPYLTNAFTPAGDGSRIMPFLRFAEAVPEVYPLWNPFRLFGVPVLADPENFVWLSWLVDAASPYANLQVNLVFLAVLWGIAFSAYLVARKLGASHMGALLGGAAMIISTYVLAWLAHGRLNVLVSFLATNLSLLCYLRFFERKSVFWLLACGLFVGLNISRIVQYSAPNLFLMLLALALFLNIRERGVARGTAVAAGHVVMLGLAGIAAFSYTLLPLVAYQLSTLSRHAMHLGAEFSPVSGLRDMFFPVDAGEYRFVFVGFFLAPLLVAGMVRARELRNTPWLPFLCVFLVSLSFLCGEVYPFKYYYELLASFNLLSHLRHAQVFCYPLSLSAAMLCAMGYDAFLKQRVRPLPFVLGGLLLCGVMVAASRAGGDVWPPAFWFGIAVVFLSCLAAGMCGGVSWAKTGLMIALLACSVGMRAWIFPEEVRGQTNAAMESLRPAYEDKGYFRTFNYKLEGDLGDRGMVLGFSLYFSDSQRRMLRALFGPESDQFSRPHYYLTSRPVRAVLPHVSLLRLLNVKYAVPSARKGFLRALRREGFVQLSNGQTWRAEGFLPALKVYDRWMEVPEGDGSLLEYAERLGVSPYDVLLLPRGSAALVDGFLARQGAKQGEAGAGTPSAVTLVDMSADAMDLDVRTDAPGVVYIPELYDRGWSATVDGVEAPVVPAQLGMRGVPVGSGSHRVRLSYTPPLLWVGLSLSVFYLLLLLSCAVRRSLRRIHEKA